MKIIPVLDVMNGIAVHAVRGEREKYTPIKSVLCHSVDPLNVALAFASVGFNDLYLADIDAILGKRTNFNLYRQIKTETSLDIMIDAGINENTGAKKILELGASKIIIGTETLQDICFISRAIDSFGCDKVVVSVDTKERKIISRSEKISSETPTLFAITLRKLGVKKIIVLDLSRIGLEQGVDLNFIREIIVGARVEVFVGGGVKDINDIEELKKIGVTGVLLATALHNGRIDPKELDF